MTSAKRTGLDKLADRPKLADRADKNGRNGRTGKSERRSEPTGQSGRRGHNAPAGPVSRARKDADPSSGPRSGSTSGPKSGPRSGQDRRRRPDTPPQREPSRPDQAQRAHAAAPSPAHAPRPLPFVPASPSAATLAHIGCTPLFQPLGDIARGLMVALPDALDAVMPLNASHRRDLPNAVMELSQLLTSERGGLDLPYWSSPRLMSAYLRYFLPWNLIRLTRLLPGLGLPKPEPEDMIIDFGSGPLTMPLALWMARPSWRDLPLTILAVDTSGQILELGRALFRQLIPDSPWRIRTLRAPLHKALREVHGRARLITTANVLNELAERSPDRRTADEGTLGDRMIDLAAALSRLLVPGGTLCCVEPGTRLGGTLISHVRSGVLEADMELLSPCPHTAICPLEGGRGAGGWCHAALDTADAPRWLQELAHEAGLGKSSLSLSHLAACASVAPARAVPESVASLPDISPDISRDTSPVISPAVASPLPTASVRPAAGADRDMPARVLSDAFAVPGLGLARYACTAKGLALIPAAAQVPQGSLVTVRPAYPPKRDGKSGAHVMVLVGR